MMPRLTKEPVTKKHVVTFEDISDRAPDSREQFDRARDLVDAMHPDDRFRLDQISCTTEHSSIDGFTISVHHSRFTFVATPSA